MFGKKKRTDSTVNTVTIVKEDPTKPYLDFLRDLATVYPAIEKDRDEVFSWGYQGPLAYFHTDKVTLAADGIRTAAKKTEVDAAIKELRK